MVRVKDTGNAALIIVAAKHALVSRSPLGFVRADEGDALARGGEVTRRCSTHEAFADDDVFETGLAHNSAASPGNAAGAVGVVWRQVTAPSRFQVAVAYFVAYN